jgi:hypothetical protein
MIYRKIKFYNIDSSSLSCKDNFAQAIIVRNC